MTTMVQLSSVDEALLALIDRFLHSMERIALALEALAAFDKARLYTEHERTTCQVDGCNRPVMNFVGDLRLCGYHTAHPMKETKEAAGD